MAAAIAQTPSPIRPSFDRLTLQVSVEARINRNIFLSFLIQSLNAALQPTVHSAQITRGARPPVLPTRNSNGRKCRLVPYSVG